MNNNTLLQRGVISNERLNDVSKSGILRFPKPYNIPDISYTNIKQEKILKDICEELKKINNLLTHSIEIRNESDTIIELDVFPNPESA